MGFLAHAFPFFLGHSLFFIFFLFRIVLFFPWLLLKGTDRDRGFFGRAIDKRVERDAGSEVSWGRARYDRYDRYEASGNRVSTKVRLVYRDVETCGKIEIFKFHGIKMNLEKSLVETNVIEMSEKGEDLVVRYYSD